MPRKRKPTIKLDDVYPETPREFPLSYWLGSLLGAERKEQELIAQGASTEALAGEVSRLVYALQNIRKLSFSALRAGAAVALPEVERFLIHPGRHVEPAYTTYSDWTMDESCAEEVPAVEVTVAGEARQTAATLRECLRTVPPERASRPEGKDGTRKRTKTPKWV